MKFKTLPNGVLEISSEPGDAEMLADIKLRNGGNDVNFLCELLDETGWSTNGKLMPINPEDVGALTDAPILTDELKIEDNGDVTVTGNVWWFPDYMVSNFADVLIEKGVVSFAAAPENEKEQPAPQAPGQSS